MSIRTRIIQIYFSMNIYKKNKKSFNILFDELVRILEGVEESEIVNCMDELPNPFSVKELKYILSKNYILYEGFGNHIQTLLKDQIAKVVDERKGRRPKAGQAGSQSKEESPAKDSPLADTEEIKPKGAGVSTVEDPQPPKVDSEKDSKNLRDKLNRVKKGIKNEPPEKPSQPELKEPKGALGAPVMSGFKLDGKSLDGFKNSLQKKLSDFSQINTVHFNADYQVDIYADQISDNLHKSVEEIREELSSNFPGMNLKINIRPDKRSKEK